MTKIEKGGKKAIWLFFRYFGYIIVVVALAILFFGCKDTKKIVKTNIDDSIDSVKVEQVAICDSTKFTDTTSTQTEIKENATTLRIEFADTNNTINLSDLICGNLSDLGNVNIKSIEITQKDKNVSQNKQNAVKIEGKRELDIKDSTNISKDLDEKTTTKEESEKNNGMFYVGIIVFIAILVICLCVFMPTK